MSGKWVRVILEGQLVEDIPKDAFFVRAGDSSKWIDRSAAKFAYCSYDAGAGDDGNPAFALIRVEGQWTAVCASHAEAAAAGEMERNWVHEAERVLGTLSKAQRLGGND